MKFYKKRNTSLESISIEKIELGINSIKNGTRSGNEVGSNLEYFFNQLEKLNVGMYEELFKKYSIVRLEAEKKEIKEIHS